MVGRDCQSWDIRLAWIIYYQLDKSYQKSTHCAKLTSRTIPWILHRCFKNPLVLHRCPKQNGKFVETCQKFVPLSIKLWRFLDHFLEDFFWARGLLNCQRPAVAFGNDKSSFRQLPLVELTWRYNYSTLLVECILIKIIDLLDHKELLSSRFFQLEKWSPNWLKIESFSHKHSVLPVWNQRQIMG